MLPFLRYMPLRLARFAVLGLVSVRGISEEGLRFITRADAVCRLCRTCPGILMSMTTITALAINLPLMVLAFGLMTGIPLWMVLRQPGRKTRADRAVPAYAYARTARYPQTAARIVTAGSR